MLPPGASCPELHALFGRTSEEAVTVCPSLLFCWPGISEMWLLRAPGAAVSSRLRGAKSRTSEPRSVCALEVRAGRSELAVVPENLNSGTCL